MKTLTLFVLLASVCSLFAANNHSNIINLLDTYQQLSLKIPSDIKNLNTDKVNSILADRQNPYAILYEHTGLFEWQLLEKFYYEYKTDTTGSFIYSEVQYKPNYDYFITVPAFFVISTKRPNTSLEAYKISKISQFNTIGTDNIVLLDEKSSKYGPPGYHYCQSFIFNATRLIIDSYFILIDNTACVVYYMTGDSYYKNMIYQISFDFILDILSFNNSTSTSSKPIDKPVHFKLNHNYPNPFNSNTIIHYSVDIPSHVKLEIYDCNGRKIKTLIDRHHSQGNYNTPFNANDLASGIYIYKLSNNRNYEIHRMVHIK
jgi:hypothetical protein